MIKATYCTKCVYPTNAVLLQVDDQGVCSSCRAADSFNELTEEFWLQRKKRFEEVISPYLNNSNSNYDCLIPVSGGKDSTRQAIWARDKLGLNPLLVCLAYPPEQITRRGTNNL